MNFTRKEVRKMPKFVRKAIAWTLVVPLLTNCFMLYQAVEGQNGFLQSVLYASVMILLAAIITLMGIVPYRQKSHQKPVDMPLELEDYDK